MKRALFLAALVGFAGFVGLAAFGAKPAAAAPPPTPEALQRARTLAEQGRVLHDRGEYRRAVDAYQEAYVLAPSPALLFNLGQAYRLGGDCDNATLMYRNFLRSNPPTQHRQVASAHLATVERCASPEGSQFRAGALLVDRSPGRGLRQGGVITAVSGGALLALAGYFAYRADDASDEVEERYGRGERWRDLQDLDERGRRDSQLATGFAIAGGAAVVTGGVLYLVGWRQAERAEGRPNVAITPSARGTAVRLAWDF